MGAVILLSDAADSILFAEGIIFLERRPKGIIPTHAAEEQAGLLVEGIRLLGKMRKMGIVSVKNISHKTAEQSDSTKQADVGEYRHAGLQ